MLTIYFKDRGVGHMERAEVYTLTDFMGMSGGLLGLFLGFSMLSIVEFIYFFTLRLLRNIRRSNTANAVAPRMPINVNFITDQYHP